MKRFSKIVSVIFDWPLAMVIRPMNCACRSVGKPGKGSVVTSTARMPLPLRLTRMPPFFLADLDAGFRQDVERALQEVGAGAFEQHVAAGHGHGHGVGAGLDAVGDDAVARARQRIRRPRW